MKGTKQTMIRRLWLVAGLALAPVLTSASSADAAWMHKRYHMGVECDAFGHSSDNPKYITGGSMRNRLSTSRGFYCGLQHLTHNYWSNDAAVYVLDRHYSDNAWCQLRAVNIYDLSYSYSGKRYTSGSSSTAQKLSFGYFNHGNDFWYLACQIPGSYSGNLSGINGYYIEEPDLG